MKSEPPYAYVRGNVVNLTDPDGMQPLASIGKIYDGESQPLIKAIIRLYGKWRIEDNLYGNDLFQDGLVRFDDYVLKIAVPRTTLSTTSSEVPTIGPPSVNIAPSLYRTILYFQGLMTWHLGVKILPIEQVHLFQKTHNLLAPAFLRNIPVSMFRQQDWLLSLEMALLMIYLSTAQLRLQHLWENW